MDTPNSIPNTGSKPFKQLAHELIDRLPRDATWQELLAEVQFQIDVEEAAPVTRDGSQ